MFKFWLVVRGLFDCSKRQVKALETKKNYRCVYLEFVLNHISIRDASKKFSIKMLTKYNDLSQILYKNSLAKNRILRHNFCDN